VARALLADWRAARAAFTAVVPVNYRKVMEAKAAAEEAGLDETATTRAMMEAANA
jgi:glutamate synthase (NADPH) large chain